MKFKEWVMTAFDVNKKGMLLDRDLTTLDNVELLVDELDNSVIKRELLFVLKESKDFLQEQKV